MRVGFTLVELSIVLVILGLLVGGVLAGQSLIHAAELRSITTQYNAHVTAVNAFKDKYFALPGDMPNAAAYWGAADGSTGNTAGCAAVLSTDMKTCNGNGDGQIINSTASNEPLRFWQHLANAGLIEGQYTGASGTNPNYNTDQNNPKGKIASSLWFPYYWSGTTASSVFKGTVSNTLRFAKVSPGLSPSLPILSPEDAYGIDMKMDDGKPGLGSLVMYAYGGLNKCTDMTTSDGNNTAADYRLSDPTVTCSPWFRNMF